MVAVCGSCTVGVMPLGSVCGASSLPPHAAAAVDDGRALPAQVAATAPPARLSGSRGRQPRGPPGPPVSFFDERDNPPGAAARRGPTSGGDDPLEPAGAGARRPPDRGRRAGRGGRPPRGPGTDRQTLAHRRAIGIGGGILLLILAALLVRGCLDAREERAFEDYVQEVSSVVAESGQESEALFELLED